ncbi:MAG: carbohydrate-binding family 9-like protein [Alistipes sp.]|nr:carbohydrate-binding family 9-like protein [Alistipes sp.]
MKSIEYIPINRREDIEEAFSRVSPEAIACNNWAEEFPYAPKVNFRMFHSGEDLHLRFEVEEQYTQALVERDNGNVWTDSCVEFFLSLDDRGYYNFETTCIGRMLMAFRKVKPEPTYATEEILSLIERTPSIGSEPFTELIGENKWTMTLKIPASALFRHELKSWQGVEARMNLYKCGDNLTKPHFLSWRPIDMPSPNFHVPQFFETVKFI